MLAQAEVNMDAMMELLEMSRVRWHHCPLVEPRDPCPHSQQGLANTRLADILPTV